VNGITCAGSMETVALVVPPFLSGLSQAWRGAAPQLFKPLINMDSQPFNGVSMTYATSAPATAGGQAGSGPVRFLRGVGVYYDAARRCFLSNR
jgi:hypothetical protein